MSEEPLDRRRQNRRTSERSLWTSGGTWLVVFVIGSGLLIWGILSLSLDGTVRGIMVLLAVFGAAVACGIGWLMAMSNAPLPALDRTPREARVREVREWDEPDTTAEEETKKVIVDYEGTDGEVHTAWLGDLIHESSIDRFVLGSRWQVYAFADPALADSTVVLTESHEDVWRSGSLVAGIHGDRGVSSLRRAAPGSLFLTGTRRFAP